MGQGELHILDAGRVAYGEALELQWKLVAGKRGGDATDYLLFVEHPPVITLGRSAKEEHVRATRGELKGRGVEVFEIERGGDVTYHGPGQVVGYPIIDLKRAGLGISEHLRMLEAILVEALGTFGIEAFTRKGLTGVWTERGKIAAIGVAVRRWISFHGFALNVNTDVSAFDLIVPCGLAGERVTSMAEALGGAVDAEAVKGAIAGGFARRLSARAVCEDAAKHSAVRS